MIRQQPGECDGLINQYWDQALMGKLRAVYEGLARIPQDEYIRETGTEGNEMVMWLNMRGALGENIEEIQRHCYVPVPNAAPGHIACVN